MTKRKNGRVTIAIAHRDSASRAPGSDGAIIDNINVDAADIAAMFKRPRKSGKSAAAAAWAVAEACRQEGIEYHAFMDVAGGS
jgi:hypothetical protein